jgi:predicted DNA-binding transcriptional regulator AlpA
MTEQSACPRLLSVQQVARRYGIATRTAWRWEAVGRIPRGLRLTATTVRWREDEIDRHLASLTGTLHRARREPP